MARIITLLVIDIQADSAWSVATPEIGAIVDRPISTEGDNSTIWLPPTALAGSLRAHMKANYPHLVEGLLGSDPPEGDAERESLVPSPLRFLGTKLTFSPGESKHIHRQTAIDRRRGAAAEKTLRSSCLASETTQIEAYLRLDRSIADEESQAIKSWKPFLGGGRSVGNGWAHLVRMRMGILDLDRREDLASWLTLGGSDLHKKCAQTEIPVNSNVHEPLLEASFKIDDGLLVMDLAKASEGAVPLKRNGNYILPGSSIKGVFRSRAEYILRSLGHDVCEASGRKGNCPCAACRVFGSVDSASTLGFRDAVIQDAVVEKRSHVAIDRLTGGAAAEHLFSENVIVAGRFTTALERLGELPGWAQGLMLMVLRDLNDGLIGFGSRTTRGYGTVRLTDETILDATDRLDETRKYLCQRAS